MSKDYLGNVKFPLHDSIHNILHLFILCTYFAVQNHIAMDSDLSSTIVANYPMYPAVEHLITVISVENKSR